MLSAVAARVDERRGGVPFKALAVISLIAAGLLAAGAYVAYRTLIHYERRAVEHLPAGMGFAARLDVEQVLLFEPIRRHLLPLLNQLPATPGSPPVEADRLSRLRREAGLNLGRDLREILVAVGPDDTRWVIVLGGLFPKQGLVTAIERVLRSEGAGGLRREGDALLFEPGGAALGQAEDGVLVLASGREVLQGALPPSVRFLELAPLSREGAGGAVLLAPGRWLERPGLSSTGIATPVSVERAGVTLRLGGELELLTQLHFATAAEAKQVAAELRRQQELSGPMLPLDPMANWLVGSGLWARANAIASAEKTVTFASSWSRADLDRAARNLAAWLQRERWPSGSARL